MTSSILQTATRFLMPLLLLFALFLLLRGHNEPGGGFVGGLVVAAAFVLYVDRLRRRRQPAGAAGRPVDAARRRPARRAGERRARASLLGRPFMTALWTTVGVGPVVGDVGTPLVFDVGVFLAVIGVVLTIVFTLADVTLSED